MENGSGVVALYGDVERQLSTESGASLARVTGQRRGTLGHVTLRGVIYRSSVEPAMDLLAEYAANDAIDAIVLEIDSPGGVIEGTADMAQLVADVAQRKRVVAYVPDLAASAAYWIASQASAIVIGPTAMVGSIGVFQIVPDFSRFYESLGIRVHVVSTGEFKGDTVGGQEISESALGEVQRVVDSLNVLFMDAVSKGRNLSKDDVERVATGQVWIGEQAVRLGLADQVTESAAALLGLMEEREMAWWPSSSRKPPKAEGEKETEMSEKTTEGKKALGLDEVRALCPGASNDDLVALLEVGTTGDENAVVQAYAKRLADQRDAAVAERDAAVAEASDSRAEAESARRAAEAAGESAESEVDAAPAPMGRANIGTLQEVAVERDKVIAEHPEWPAGSRRAEAMKVLRQRRPDLFATLKKEDRKRGSIDDLRARAMALGSADLTPAAD